MDIRLENPIKVFNESVCLWMVYGSGRVTYSSGTKETSELVGRKLRTTVGDNVLRVAFKGEDCE